MSDNNETVDFRDLLRKPKSEFPDMPDLPAKKTFYGKLIKMTAGHSKNKGTPLFHFDVRLTDPGKDVTSSDMDKISKAGFSLADYPAGVDFYLVPGFPMRLIRRFINTLGFGNDSTSIFEDLKLDENCNPTDQTQDLLRGLDVMVITPAANDRGSVFVGNCDQIAGVQRQG